MRFCYTWDENMSWLSHRIFWILCRNIGLIICLAPERQRFESASPRTKKHGTPEWTFRVFWQGQKDLNPRPMVLEWVEMPENPWKCSFFRAFQPLLLARPCVEIVSENYWCFFDALWNSAVLLHLPLFWCYSKFASQKSKITSVCMLISYIRLS